MFGTVVMKFGGTSLATPARIRAAAARVLHAHRAGLAVVVVADQFRADHAVPVDRGLLRGERGLQRGRLVHPALTSCDAAMLANKAALAPFVAARARPRS